MLQIRNKEATMMKLDFRCCDTKLTRKVIGILVLFCSLNLAISSHSARYSAPLNNSSEDEFKPLIFTNFDSKLIERQQFTKTGQYRVFEPVESDLRLNRKEFDNRQGVKVQPTNQQPTALTTTSSPEAPKDGTIVKTDNSTNDSIENELKTELKEIEDLLSSYLDEVFVRKNIEKSGISIKINDTLDDDDKIESSKNESKLEKNLKRFVRSAVVNVSLPRAASETGRLFFFSGLKKILWPIFIGIQIIKSLLFALFLPSIIGSLGKIVTQGSSSIAGFNRPSETVNDLNFKDTFEDDSKFMVMGNDGYGYNQPEASSNHFSTQLYDAAEANNILSRLGYNDNRNNNLNNFGFDENKYDNVDPGGSSSMPEPEAYNTFKKLPPSSLVLSNYDPFYSPLLSRIDAILEQLGLQTKDENCKEKLICFMYADPKKYSPYSNLVSAQLSRELDELRKPTSENEEILRFFKYMKAAKDGQDGVNCEETYSMCTDFKDFDTPAMLKAYNNINKLIEARKLK